MPPLATFNRRSVGWARAMDLFSASITTRTFNKPHTSNTSHGNAPHGWRSLGAMTAVWWLALFPSQRTPRRQWTSPVSARTADASWPLLRQRFPDVEHSTGHL